MVNVIEMENTYFTFESLTENFTEAYQPDLNGSLTSDGNFWLATMISVTNETVNKIHPPGKANRNTSC